MEDVLWRLLQLLPHQWVAVSESDHITALLLSRDVEKTTQRRVSVFFNGSVDIRVHRAKPSLEVCKAIVKDLEVQSLHHDSIGSFVSYVVQVVMEVQKYEVCSGCVDEKYKCFWNTTANGVVDNNHYGESRYTSTFRSKFCQLLILPNKKRCMECYNISQLLRRRMLSHASGPKLNTPNIHLTELEKVQKMEKLMKLLDSKRKIIAKLRKQVYMLLTQND